MKHIWNRIRHIFGIHKFKYLRRISPGNHQVECIICKKIFSFNSRVKILVEYDKELEDFYREMGHIK